MEKAHLLLMVPLAAGLLAWGAAGLPPDYYKSEASINAQLSVPPGVRSEDLILHPLNFTRLLLTRIGIATWLITELLLVMSILLKEALSGVNLTGVQLRRWELIRQRFQRR